nr:E3 ubiquitin-protein ligase TRIM39-like [Paramormyrops kingsleyae]
MIADNMDLLWRIFSALSFDCFRRESCTGQRSPTKSSQAGSVESSSLSGSLSLGPDLLHCQCCITYDARLRRLSCGHLYCDACIDRIVNLAFEDIEGLSDYPCPMCKSIRQLGDLLHVPDALSTPVCVPFWNLQRQVVKGEEWRGN